MAIKHWARCGLVLLGGLSIACNSPASSVFSQPAAGEHPTLEQYFHCRAEDVEIVVSDWGHISKESMEAMVRNEFRQHVVVSPDERQKLMKSFHAIGWYGKGTMKIPSGVVVNWTQTSTLIEVSIPKNGSSDKDVLLRLVPHQWLKDLNETRKG